MRTLYDYFRSTASYRVRIALNLKGLEYKMQEVHLLREGGEQFSDDYRTINPQCLVPSYTEDDTTITQSLAILEYIEEQHPEPALLPKTPQARARVRSIALTIACDIHPLNNLRVLKYLTGDMGLLEEQKLSWYRHWIALGFEALENRLANDPQTSQFCHGDQPTFADICLIPQIYNAKRFECNMNDYPTLLHINENCQKLEAFSTAAPSS